MASLQNDFRCPPVFEARSVLKVLEEGVVGHGRSQECVCLDLLGQCFNLKLSGNEVYCTNALL